VRRVLIRSCSKENIDYGSDQTQDTKNGRRSDGNGSGAARVC
jgi:hypothetical protein